MGAATLSETEGNKEGYKHLLHVDRITYFKKHLATQSYNSSSIDSCSAILEGMKDSKYGNYQLIDENLIVLTCNCNISHIIPQNVSSIK